MSLKRIIWVIAPFCLLHLSAGLCGSQDSITVNVRGDITNKIFTMPKNCTFNIKAVLIPTNISSLIFQVHSQQQNLTLSEYPKAAINSAITGKNIGLTVRLQNSESEKAMWLSNFSEMEINVLLVISSSDSYGPIPGGCNMEFPTEIAPYLKLKSDTMRTYLEYQHASFGSPRNVPHPKCSISTPYITYEIYVLFLEENNFGEKEYFKKVEYMSKLSSIKEYSSKTMSYSLHPDTRYSFLMYPNLGVVYNVIAKYTVDNEVKEAAYIPIVSYGCSSFDFTEYGCRIKYSVKGKTFLFLLSIYGFLVAFFGYSFIGPDVFFFGLLAFFMVGLILLGKYLTFSKQSKCQRLWEFKYSSEIEVTAELSIAVGLLGGALCLVLWIWLRNSIILLLLNGLVLGFLLTATVFYTPIGNFEIFVNHRNLWALLSVGTLLITVLSLALPTAMTVLGASIVGCYSMLLFYDDFVGTRLSYIILNIIKRAVSKNLDFATNDYPFQTKDIIMSTVWVILSLLAIIIWSTKLLSKRSRVGCANPSCYSHSVTTRNRSGLVCSNTENDLTFQPLLRNNNTIVYRTFS